MKSIAEVVRLKSKLESKIKTLIADSVMLETVQNAKLSVAMLKSRLELLKSFEKNYTTYQWLIEDKFPDSKILDHQDLELWASDRAQKFQLTEE